MKIIIPVSPSDIHRATKHAQVLRKAGGLEKQEVIYFATPSTAEQAHDVARILDAQVAVMEVEPHAGWPIGPNQQFAAAVVWLGNQRNTSPFLWMELDMLPAQMSKKWAPLMEQEYLLKGCPFLGNVVPFGMAVDGQIRYQEGDTMMMGCGIYPPNMHADERIRWAIANLGKPPNQQPRINGHVIAFDVYLRNPMKAFGVADTKLIADQWNTGHYYEDEGGLHCDALPHDRPHRPRGGIVAPEALLIHGCKDDSLVDMLLDLASWEDITKNLVAVPTMPKFVTVPKADPEFKPTTIADWKVDIKVDEESFRQTGEAIAEKLLDKPIPDPRANEVNLKERVLAILADGKKHKVSDVAKAVGVHHMRLGHLLPGMGLAKDPKGFVKTPAVKPVKPLTEMKW